MRAPSSSGRRQSSLFFTFTITLNALLEETFTVLPPSTLPRPLEDDLREDAAIRLFVDVRL